MSKHHQVIIIGGGTAGIMVASQMLKKNSKTDIGLFEPAKKHYYQPAWTLVGANTYNYDKTARSMESVMPKGVTWYKEFVTKMDPDNNKISTKDGDFTYDYLVVAPGLRMAPELVKGLPEAMDKGVVCSNYTDPKHTWEVLKNFKGGTALFTQPTTPIKCGGAPQKIMYLAEDHFVKSGVRDKTKVVFATPGSVIFGVKPIAKTLMSVIDRKDINIRFHHRLVEVDGENQIAWYELGKDVMAGGCVVIQGDNEGHLPLDESIQYNYHKLGTIKKDGRFGIKFDMMHLAPPQAAPKFVAESPLANEGGWVSVSDKTLQSTKYDNVFGLGDAAQLPTAKTGAAIRKQVPVVVANILNLIKSNALTGKEYNGYSSCPLVTGYGKMVLAEFTYGSVFAPDPKLKQFPLMISDSSVEHWRLWILKKYLLPYLYWNKMMKGVEV